MPVGQEFINIGWSLKGGLPYLPWAAAIAKKRTEDLRLEDPTSFCLPIGIVRLHTMALLKKMIQVPGLLVILNEHNATYRQIFTDGGCRSIRIRRGSGTSNMGRRRWS
jgi:hypothetical protein